mmetsp:Transcript_14155/g.21607  ORF Transcript_14155/g.21607 Transcript_14155/m.21607 type:complete len:275 (-) Transcript_14155:128-952(-)
MTSAKRNLISSNKGIPIGVFRRRLKRFQILKNKGKTFFNGGFGTSLPKYLHQDQGENLYLWIEEALFLHDAGLAQFVDEVEKEKEAKTSSNLKTLTTKELHLLLQFESGVDLAAYLTFSHLRSQSYRVLRHSESKRAFLNQKPSQQQITTGQDKKGSLRDKHREWMLHAPPPKLWEPCSPSLSLAWDVYAPNSQFCKTNPGPPLFSVLVVSYSQPSPTFSQMKHLLSEIETLKIAAVADSGTVVMFGVTNFGVPNLVKRNEQDDESDEKRKSSA